MTGILSYLSYRSSITTRGQQCATEMKYIRKPICLTKLIHKLLFLKTLVPRHIFEQNGIDITRNNDQKVKLV